MSGERLVEADSRGAAFDHVGNGSIAKTCWPGTSVSVDSPESGACGDV